jgi:hypothetical protein
MTKTPKALKAAPREPCRRDAAFVAWMLRTLPDEVFPCGPDTSMEGDDHLVLFVALKVDALDERLNDEDDGTEAFAAHRRRVLMCANVMSGKLSAPPPSMWSQMAEKLERGIYLSPKAHLRGKELGA